LVPQYAPAPFVRSFVPALHTLPRAEKDRAPLVLQIIAYLMRG